MRGLGIDRHFFGLYLIAKGLNIKPFPKLFEHMVTLIINVVTFITEYLTLVMVPSIHTLHIPNAYQVDKIL